MLDKLFCLYGSSVLHRGVSGVLRSNLPPVERDTLHSCSFHPESGAKNTKWHRNNICTNYVEIVPYWVKVPRMG